MKTVIYNSVPATIVRRTLHVCKTYDEIRVMLNKEK